MMVGMLLDPYTTQKAGLCHVTGPHLGLKS